VSLDTLTTSNIISGICSQLAVTQMPLTLRSQRYISSISGCKLLH